MARFEVIDYDPLPVFDTYHQFAGREGAAIGGYGSGKSVALCAELLKQAFAQPGSEWLLARKTINSLRDTTEQTFFNMLPPGVLKDSHVVRGGGHVQYIVLPGGSKIHFKGLDDWRKLKSLNLAGFFIDEADEVEWETYVGLKSRVRQVHPLPGANAPHGTVIRSGIIRIAMNPNGHDPYWTQFVKGQDRRDGGRMVGDGDRMAFLSTSLDNPYNPFSYIEDLLNMPEPWVRRYVFCSFDDFQGVIYPEWDWQTHTVNPYGYYDSNIFFMGMDPGTQNPTAGVWCYVDRTLNGGTLVAIAEYLAPGVDVSSHVHSWRRIEAAGTHNLTRRPGRMSVGRRIADPSIATRDRGSMNSLESLYARHAFIFEHGPKNIPDRLPSLGELIHVGRFRVTKECEMLYEQIKNYRYEDLTPEQIGRGVEAKPFKRSVDLVDATQYITSRWVSPAITRPERVARPKVRIASQHDQTIMEHVKALRDDGMLVEAAMLERELIPDGALEDVRQGVLRRRVQHVVREKTAGLA